MRVRPARPGDQDDLRKFRCADASHHQADVERWVQHKAIKWARQQPGNALWVAVELAPDDETELIVGCVAYEPGEFDEEWFVRALAIGRRRQGEGLGTSLLMTVLRHLSTVTPGGLAYWKVDPTHDASCRMSSAVGAEADDLAGSEFVVFSVPFPELPLDEELAPVDFTGNER